MALLDSIEWARVCVVNLADAEARERPPRKPAVLAMFSYLGSSIPVTKRKIGVPLYPGYGNDSRQDGPLSSLILHITYESEFAFYWSAVRPSGICTSFVRTQFCMAIMMLASLTTTGGHAQAPANPPADPNLPAPGTRGNADNVPFIGSATRATTPFASPRRPGTSRTTTRRRSRLTRCPTPWS